MIKKGLLSIITPCYNTAHLVTHLLDSVLIQDYPHIEMFVVDDGSTDNIRETIQDYATKFLKKGYSLNLISQENLGQSVAVDRALKKCSGEFLTWPDSDDYIIDKCYYSKMIDVLRHTGDDVTTVRCFPSYVKENTSSEIRKQMYLRTETSIFEECLWASSNFWFPPICYMVKMVSVDKLIPLRNIYTEKNAGQNWQLMLPLFYKHRCITIPEWCVCILERSSSHSRGQYHTYKQLSEKYLAYQNTIKNTLLMMNSEMKDILYEVDCKYFALQISLALSHRKFERLRYFFLKMCRLPIRYISAKGFLSYILSYIPGRMKILNLFYKMR